MKKFFKYLVLIIIFLIIVVQFGLRQPSIQDKLLEIAIENIAAPSAYLPEEDALTAVVCGSRSPLPSPGRAEACILVEAGDDIYIFDLGNGSMDNLTQYQVPSVIKIPKD